MSVCTLSFIENTYINDGYDKKLNNQISSVDAEPEIETNQWKIVHYLTVFISFR